MWVLASVIGEYNNEEKIVVACVNSTSLTLTQEAGLIDL